MKTLPPQHLLDTDYESIERQLKRIFWKIVYEPIVETIADFNVTAAAELELRNATVSALSQAIQFGRIQYQDGIFSGEFSASTSSALRALGAAFDKRARVYRLDASRVPASIKGDAALYQHAAKAAHAALSQKLTEMEKQLDDAVNIHTVDPTRTLQSVEKRFEKVGRNLEVMPTLSTLSVENLSKSYTSNMKLYIKDWSHGEIQHLRSTVKENAEAGYRFDTLASHIKDRYDVSASKAKFLARQETALFMSKYREERFSEAGVTKYRWSTSRDERVRDSHKHLDGKTFSYKVPPVVDLGTGRRGNPGSDFGCRCVDMPVLEAA